MVGKDAGAVFLNLNDPTGIAQRFQVGGFRNKFECTIQLG